MMIVSFQEKALLGTLFPFCPQIYSNQVESASFHLPASRRLLAEDVLKFSPDGCSIHVLCVNPTRILCMYLNGFLRDGGYTKLLESRSGREGRCTNFRIVSGLRGDQVTVGVQT